MAVRPDGLTTAAVPRPARAARARRPRRRQHLRHAARPARRPGGRTASSCRCTGRPRWTTATGWSSCAVPTTAGPTSAWSPARCSRCPAASVSRCSTGYPDPSRPSRLWRARTAPDGPGGRRTCRRTDGRSATATCAGAFPLSAFQTVYADRAGQRRDGQRRAAVHRGGPGRAHGPRRPRRPAGPAHRRLQPRAARAAVPRAVRRPGGHRPAGEQHPAGRPPRRRRRHDRHPGAGDGDRTRTASRGPPPAGPTSSSARTARPAPSPA